MHDGACEIKISHNNCLRCIFFADKRENATPYLTLLDILKLENILKLKIGSLVHKLQYNKQETPPALHDLVSLASDVHKHNTRIATGQNFCLRSKRSRTSRTKYRDARRSFRIRDARKMGREQNVPPSLVLFALAPFSSRPKCENSFSRPDISFGSYGNACYARKP